MISAAERKRREDVVNAGRASVGLEGFTLSQADEEHAQRFISGEIELAEFDSFGARTSRLSHPVVPLLS